MNSDSRTTFKSKIGIIMAAVGSAVGLGNIWRFPYEAGQNGGGAFLLIYLLCVLVMGIPTLLAEMTLGRMAKTNSVEAFRRVSKHPVFSRIGYLGVLSCLLILGFYTVVAGWTFQYMWESVSGGIVGGTTEQFAQSFVDFSTSPFQPLFWTLLMLVFTHLIIIGGVQKGIERASKLMMPLLFVLLVVLCVNSLMLDGAREGLLFLFKPDFSAIDSGVVLSAMGQAFFSLSLGAGVMITYASYFEKEVNMPRTATTVALLDTSVALLAGIVIFPAVFTFGIQPTQGPNLVFVTLPNIFAQLPWGSVWSFIFFLLLALASITSLISLHQVVTAYVEEEFRVSNRKAALIVTCAAGVLTVFASLSLGVLNDLRVGGMCLFDLLDFVTAKIMMPVGSLLLCVFMGWRLEKSALLNELTNYGTLRWRWAKVFVVVLKYVVPILVTLIFVNELGVFKF
ncbi:MAG: sodium-dependent transporter [Rikenellaceae bacterium]|nr:sodium-dependent transporter [Rikenellaceae bacterium]